MAYKHIKLDTWARKSHFEFFQSSQGSVRLSLTQPLNVTSLVSFCRQHSLSFYYSLIFLVTQTANDIPGFKQRIKSGVPIEHDTVHPLFTDLNAEDDLFKLVMASMNNNIQTFAKQTQQQARSQDDYLPIEDFIHRHDILNITCYPWGDFSSLQVKPVQQNKEDPGIPFIAWGQYQQQGKQLITSLHTEVSHCFLDAIHIYQFKKRLEEKIHSLI